MDYTLVEVRKGWIDFQFESSAGWEVKFGGPDWIGGGYELRVEKVS